MNSSLCWLFIVRYFFRLAVQAWDNTESLPLHLAVENESVSIIRFIRAPVQRNT
jgi:hypothetical protein